MRIVPSSSMSIWTSKSDSSERIVSPPLPITIPMYSGLILTVGIRGAWPASSSRGAGSASSIRSRMNARACFACSSASRMICCVTPVILMSIWSAVIPFSVPAFLFERQVVDPLALLRRAQRQQGHDLRLPAGEERRAVRPRRDGDLALDRADLLRAPPVRAPLLDRDLAPDELLVERLGRALHELPREAVLHLRRLALDRRRADRERQLDALLDPVEE